MATKKNEEKVTYVNEFGVPLFIDKKSKSQLRERVRLLNKVVQTGRPIGSKKVLSKKDIERAEMHVRWYSAEIKKLTGKKSKGSKKAS